MDGFEADIAALRAAAAAAAAVAEQAGGVDLAGSLGGVPLGMPGSESAAVAERLAVVWGERLDSWTAAVRGHGEKVGNAANDYQANDEAAAASFSGGFLDGVLPWL